VPAVPPCGELRSQRLSYPDEICAFSNPAESDLIGRSSRDRRTILALAFFNGLPSLFEGGEIPPPALSANNPKPSLRAIEREPTTNGKMLYRFVPTECGMAEDAG